VASAQPPPRGSRSGENRPRPPRQRRNGTLPAAAAGLIAGATALGVGQLTAGVMGPQYSPVITVGAGTIDLAPPAVREFAISMFGPADKTVLLGGVVVVLAAFAAATGALAARRLGYGLCGLAVLAGIGLVAAMSRPGAPAAAVIPPLAAAAAGATVLTLLIRSAPPRADDRPAVPGGGAGSAASPSGDRWAQFPGGDAGDAADTADPGDTADAMAAAGPAGRQGRRAFLAAGAGSLVVASASALAGNVLDSRFSVAASRSKVRFPAPSVPVGPLPPGTDLGISGLNPFVTPNQSFYRVDTALVLPDVPSASWRLRIYGMVEREITIGYGDLLRRPLTETYITLTCVSDPVDGPYIGNARWLGASLADLLRAARVQAGADQLLCTSADGFTSGTPIAAVLDDRDALLAVAMNGAPLPVAHGFPVRMVVPGLYGYVSATKWLTDIKVTTFAAEIAYWAQRGYAQQAPIKTESRIDVPTGLGPVPGGKTKVAGEAWAQHTGIDAVHVRVDAGPWQQARLAAVPNIDTWRQWVWDWDAAPGIHTIEARATDATGYTQTAVQAPTIPNGTSGYPSVTLRVT
jgi:DMSO/TMAO reductase YedYZ molybdopterin-dependent catalytic subunit